MANYSLFKLMHSNEEFDNDVEYIKLLFNEMFRMAGLICERYKALEEDWA